MIPKGDTGRAWPCAESWAAYLGISGLVVRFVGFAGFCRAAGFLGVVARFVGLKALNPKP